MDGEDVVWVLSDLVMFWGIGVVKWYLYVGFLIRG